MKKKRSKKIALAIAIAVIIFILGILAAKSPQDKGQGTANTTEIRQQENKTFSTPSNFSIIDIPPATTSLNAAMSREVVSALGNDIVQQDGAQIIASLLATYKVKYVVFYNKSYTHFFEKYIEGESDIDSHVSVAKINMSAAAEGAKEPFLVLHDDWYLPENGNNVQFRWSTNQTSVLYYSAENASKILRITAKGLEQNEAMGIRLNGQDIEEVSLWKDYTTRYIPMLFAAGQNNITFTDKDGCSNVESVRCLGFAFASLEVMDPSAVPEKGFIQFENFYPEDLDSGRWMGKNAVVYIFSQENYSGLLSFGALSYAKPRQLIVSDHDIVLANQSLSPAGADVSTVVKISSGDNELAFSSDGCDSPSVTEKTADSRCLGIKIRNLEIKALK
jgi:hypothetical protein